MNILKVVLLGNTVEDWFLAFAVMILTLVALRILRKGVGRKIAGLAGKAKIENGQMLDGVLDRTKFYFLAILAIYGGSLIIELPRWASSLLRQATILVFLLQLGIWFGWVISCWVDISVKEKKESDPARATGIGAIGFLLRFGLWAAILLLALDNMGFSVTTVLAGLGVGGIAVALAVQNILGDLFASLTIVLDKPFVIGDFIIVGDFKGTVEHIGLKTTRVRSLSGEHIIFPNSNLLQSRVKNYSKMQERRIVFSIGVVYQTPAEKLKEIPEFIGEIINSHEMTRFDRAHFKEYGDFGLIFEIVYYVLCSDYNKYMDLQQSINLAILNRFQKDKIEFAYPTHTVFLNNPS